MDVELHDWEVLDESVPVDTTTYLDGMEGDSEGVIRPDYFSLDYSTTQVEDQISVESDNPSWIEPVCDTNYSTTKPTGEFWSTDGSESEASHTELGEVESKDNIDVLEQGRVVVWWKLPLNLLKHCYFRASPVWRLSVAAAMIGVVILGRRLYKMKQKTRRLQLKVTIDDDKKVSQVMSRAARLNEAFSIVKRAPIIRPSLPATGIAPWPVMALT